jgi:hypothetical protein
MGLLNYVENQQNRAQNISAYQDLLNRYGIGQDVSQSTAIPNDFYLQAAGIPGFGAGLLTGGQSNQGAMERQTQAQDFGLNNVPLAQEMLLNEQKRSNLANENWQLFQHQNPSAYQAQTLEQNWNQNDYKNKMEQYMFQNLSAFQQGQLADLAQQRSIAQQKGLMPELPKGMALAQGPDGPMAAYIPGAPDARATLERMNNLMSGLDSIGRYSSYLKKYGPTELWNTEARGAAGQDFQNIITARAALGSAGVIQPGELPRLQAGLLDPNSPLKNLNPFATAAGAQGSAEGSREQLLTKLADLAASNPDIVTPEIRGAIKRHQAERLKLRGLLSGG